MTVTIAPPPLPPHPPCWEGDDEASGSWVAMNVCLLLVRRRRVKVCKCALFPFHFSLRSHRSRAGFCRESEGSAFQHCGEANLCFHPPFELGYECFRSEREKERKELHHRGGGPYRRRRKRRYSWVRSPVVSLTLGAKAKDSSPWRSALCERCSINSISCCSNLLEQTGRKRNSDTAGNGNELWLKLNNLR